jgi:hypothetical protein
LSTRPLSYLNWTDGNASKVVQPPGALALQGWVAGQPPPFQYANYQLWLLDQWVQYLDQITNTSAPDQVIRLINGGYYSFNATSGAFAWSATANLAIAGVPDSNNAFAASSVTIADGQVAYVTVNPPIILNADSTIGSTSLTNVNFTGNLVVGMTFTGNGIPSGTMITGVGPSSVSISHAATTAQTQGTFIASETGALTVTVVDNIAFIPSLTTIMIARRTGAIVYVGVNTGQMILRDGEYKPLLGSGYFDTYDIPAGQNLTAGQVVYVSPGASDSSRTAGAVYPLDCSASQQAVRGVYAGVVISAVTAGATATVLYNGFYAFTGLTPGVNYFSDPAVPGGIITPQPTDAGVRIVPVGFAVTANSMIVTSFNGVGGSFSQPVMKAESLGTGNGTKVAYTTSATPLNPQSIFVYLDGGITSAWSLLGNVVTFNTAPAAGQEVYVQYVEAGQAYLQGFQGTAVGVVDGTNTTFMLPFVPANLDSLSLFVDGGIISNEGVTLTTLGGNSSVTLPTAPAIGQNVYATGLSPVGLSIYGGEVTGGQNLGTGKTVFKQVSGTSLQFKTIKAGSNTSITDDGSTLTIASTGGGGGSSVPTIYGSIATPESFDPAVGLVPGPENDQIWFLSTNGFGGGVLPVTAVPQIADGSFVGQRLTLRGVDATNYYAFQGAATPGDYQNGLSMNGSCNITNNQSLQLFWDGSGWYEASRR